MIRQASLHCTQLKENLIQTLTDIRVDGKAYRFCSVILRAKKIIEPSLRKPPLVFKWNIIQETDRLALELKSLASEIKPGFEIANKIMKSLSYCVEGLDWAAGKVDIGAQLLSEINNSESLKRKYKNSAEYFKHLIIATDYLLLDFFNYEQLASVDDRYDDFSPDNPYDYLSICQESLDSERNSKTEELLSIIFKIGEARLEFSKEEKIEIGKLMIESLEQIKAFIEGFSFLWLADDTSSSNLESNKESKVTLGSILKKRSALQFLVDDYATFPAGNGILLNDFYGDKINTSVRRIEHMIKVWCSVLTDGDTDKKEKISDCVINDVREWLESKSYLKEAGENKVPESHTWWADSIKKCITEADTSRKLLKMRLVERSKDVIICDNAFRFCDLILEAKKIINANKSNPSLHCYGSFSLRADMITQQLKNFISRNKLEQNSIKLFIARLEDVFHHIHKKEPERASQILLELNDSESLNVKYKNSEDYLNNLIIATDYIVCPFSSLHPTFPLKHTKGNNTLYEAKTRLTNKKNIEELLTSIIEIGQARPAFSNEEKMEIGALMIQILEPMKTLLKNVTSLQSFNHAIGTYIIKELPSRLDYRAALQFFMEYYATFPAENELLLKDVYGGEIKDMLDLSHEYKLLW